ncbi:MAG: hypothetical protein IH851_09115 [Armatimonadetes bacterium]|nr:hypothetical protein [Armatimonadota bacterium]
MRQRRRIWTALAIGAAIAAPGGAFAQLLGFNIDLDIGSGSPEIGNGAPSDAFPGAAGQPGRWNRVGGPVRLPQSGCMT